ncbi:BTB/POZ protein [Rhizophagus clarus]|nr:BTB/POZ protein [Rhizophagus clarus]
MLSESSQDVINDYGKLLENDEGYDVIIYVSENENEKEIHAHSVILRIRSQYFRAAFSKECHEKIDGKFIFRRPNISSQLFEIILRFIYCGKIDLENLHGHNILKLLLAVNELEIQTLINNIQEYLIKYQDGFLQQNLVEILETVYQHKPLSELFDRSLKKICEEPEILFNSNKFINLKPSLLELVLERDDLLLDEIVIWDNLIKWCLAQHSNISQDPTQWNNEDITIMKKTIHKFISLIRFNHISSESFATKIYPFKEIMAKKLVNNIRDGNTNTAFHNNCDNKGDTLVVVKIKDSNQIVGGYTPLNWDSSDTLKFTYDIFIFSFANKDNLQSLKVSYGNGSANSIYCRPINGPVFGISDLYFYEGSWHSYINDDSSYLKIDIPSGFNADDYEVFQVFKK